MYNAPTIAAPLAKDHSKLIAADRRNEMTPMPGWRRKMLNPSVSHRKIVHFTMRISLLVVKTPRMQCIPIKKHRISNGITTVKYTGKT
jgi:hypothetical protein